MDDTKKDVKVVEKVDSGVKTEQIALPAETLAFFKGDEIRARVFFEKYALKDEEGRTSEKLPAEMWDRVAEAISSVEASEQKRAEWHDKFKWLLYDFRFLPGGRILFGAGQHRKSTLLNCFAAGTRVYTDTGLKNIETVKVGDMVLTHNNRYREVTDFIPQAKRTTLMKLRMHYNNREIVCTPEHKFLTHEGEWVEAKDLSRDSYIRVGIEPSVAAGDQVLHLKDYISASNLITLNGAIYTEVPYSIRNKYGAVSQMVKRSVVLKDSVSVSNDLGRFVGLFLSEGGISKPSTLYFTFSLKEQGYAEEVLALSEKLFGIGGKIRKISRGSGGWIRVEIYSQVLCSVLLGMCGHYCYDKKIPQELLSQNDQFIMSIIGGLFAGDGCVTDEGVFLQLSNEALSYQVHKLLLRLGVVNSIQEVDNGRFARRKAYRITVSSLYFAEKVVSWMNKTYTDSILVQRPGSAFKLIGGELSFKIKDIEALPESDVIVYDLGVADDHSFVVEDVVAHNCYVIPVKDDTLEAIFDWCKEAARTYSYGGGVGTDISVLRPRNAPVNNSAVLSSGAVSFMNLFSETTHTIGQHGRRGALMITMGVDHPDVMEFITVKRNLGNVRYANISLRITDEFMRAVKADGDFTLRFENKVVGRKERVVRARMIWDELVRSARDWAEPGLIFWDTVKRYSPSEYNGMNVIGTNPCSEQPLQPYGACDLGNINLSYFVVDEFSDHAKLDWESLEKTVRYSVRFLDDVLDYNDDKHPLKEQSEAARTSRRIGVGITGLGDMLVKLKIKYDSDRALALIDDLFNRIKCLAYDESVEIAREKGSFPMFDAQKHLSMDFIKTLPRELQEKIGKVGLRNVAILTVPPTGSVSVLAGTSSGVEPIFAFSYTRRSESLSQEYFKVYHPLALEYMKLFNIAEESELPDFFVPAHRIQAEFRVKMQGVVQKHIDSAISSTVNLPREATAEEVGKIYFQAWEAGCKGITVYREGSREGVLITDSEQERKLKAPEVTAAKAWKRDRLLTGQTMKVKLQEGSLYVTANFDDVSIKEVFINLGKTGSEEKSYCEAIGRLVSKFLQLGGNVEEVVASLKGIKSSSSITWDKGMKIYSVPDAIGKSLEIMSGIVEPSAAASLLKADADKGKQMNIGASISHEGGRIKPDRCPSCSEDTLVNENGCFTCMSCGYTKCE